MTESQKHRELKRQAVKILQRRGFNAEEIFREYIFRDRRIDIAGVKSNKIILIECGGLQARTKKLFNEPKTKFEFIHLPYLKNIDRANSYCLTLDSDLIDKVDKLAKKQNCSRSKIVNKFIKGGLKK